jgi:ATP-binding protein involved in chromosome partitioning
MAYFTPEELPENKYIHFGKEGLRIFRRFRCAFLGEFLLVQSIREAGDGRPAAANGPLVELF